MYNYISFLYMTTPIPTNIFQTWHTKLLPPSMAKSIQSLQHHNPRFKYYLFDDKDCREFIRTHFRPDVLYAYDTLIPGAYKADLWRYCVLFIHGGVYLDIKYMPVRGFRFIQLMQDEHYVADINNRDIYNAFIVSRPGSPILHKAIRKIVENVAKRFYGSSPLEPTGPTLLGQILSSRDPRVDMRHDTFQEHKFIYYKNVPILKSYTGHNQEKARYSIKPHYSTLWNKRQIYNTYLL